jgi:two-component system sensor histidine kinase KdpD
MTRLLYGTIRPARDWASLGELAGPVLERLAEPLAAHPVRVDIPGDLPLARIDPTLVSQALANLLENAAKHTPPGTPIRLEARVRDAELLVSVEDAGRGLPAGDAERLFAKFQHGTQETAVGGVGLGLAICRAIVRLHGGRIWAERLSPGTAFRFTLPLEPAPRIPLEAATPG